MKILHARDENTGLVVENAFVAVEGHDVTLGRCAVKAHIFPELLPERPHIVDIEVSGEEHALDALYGAGTARARWIASNAGMNAEIRTECDDALRERLKALGYRGDDALVRMRRTHRSGPVIKRLPDRCTIVFDTLDDELEARYFVKRYNALFATDDGMTRLKALREKPGFSRTVMVAPEGLAGEMLAWAEDNDGVIGYLYTAPTFRRRGVADYLLDLARKYFLDAGILTSRMDVWERLYAAYGAASNAGFRPAEALKRYAAIDIDREEI